jgi:predicted N-acetyltransferase YhbS
LERKAVTAVSHTLLSQASFSIEQEKALDLHAREALLDRALGAGRKRKSSEKLRRGRLPADGLAFAARDAFGSLIGTVRLWNVVTGNGVAALLLGPLAVTPKHKGAGVGSALMRQAIDEAKRLEHGAILLVGDAPYYARFGFSVEKTGGMSMPGPFEKARFLGLELKAGALDRAAGTLVASGRKMKAEKVRAAA